MAWAEVDWNTVWSRQSRPRTSRPHSLTQQPMEGSAHRDTCLGQASAWKGQALHTVRIQHISVQRTTARACFEGKKHEGASPGWARLGCFFSTPCCRGTIFSLTPLISTWPPPDLQVGPCSSPGHALGPRVKEPGQVSRGLPPGPSLSAFPAGPLLRVLDHQGSMGFSESTADTQH